MARPKISILSPSYNYAGYLRQALESVRQQAEACDFGVEHVVVDGGSTDGSIEILNRQKFAKWVSEPDNGQSDALNKALSMAQGEWIGWLNVDDFYLPGSFALAMAVSAEADVVYGDYFRTDADGKAIELVASHGMSGAILRNYGPFIPSCATFIRHAAMLPEGNWDPRLRRVMDWDLWLKLEERGARFKYLRAPLAGFREHGDNVSAAGKEGFESEYEILSEAHGVFAGPGRRVKSAAALLAHAGRKAVNGSYLRELYSAHRVRGRLIVNEVSPT